MSDDPWGFRRADIAPLAEVLALRARDALAVGTLAESLLLPALLLHPAAPEQPEQPGDDEAAEPVAGEDDHDSATEQPEEPAAAEPEAEEADGPEDAAGTPVPPEAADDAEDEDEAASEEQESP